MPISKLASEYIPVGKDYGQRYYPVSKITLHHMAGISTAAGCAMGHRDSDRQASANYYIGYDGEIVCGVVESEAAWTSSSWDNDSKSITVEISNDDTSTWSISQKSWDAAVALCVDICQRYGIDELVYTGDASGNFTEHSMFSATACPGPWLHPRIPQIAAEINSILHGETGDDDMQALYRPDGKSYMVWYDGHSLHKLDNPDEMTAVKKFYKQVTGKDIPTFEFGTAKAPWAHRFEDAVNHGFDQAHM